MQLSRKKVLAGGASVFATVAVVRFPGEAAEFNYKLANDQPLNHPMTAQSIEAAAKVLKDSGGQLDIKVFPNSQLGNDTQMLAQVRSGALEFVQMGDNLLANVVPVAALEGIPFAFADDKQFLAAADGPLGAYIRTACSKVGLYQLQKTWLGGSRQMINRVLPINVPDDLKGLKIRVPEGPIDFAVFKAFNAVPTPINISEAYVAMQTHVVDGAESPLTTIENQKFYEVQKYISMTNHIAAGYKMLANVDAWAKLPKNLQTLVENTFNAAAAVASVQLADEIDNKLTAKLRDQGMVFNRPDVAPFRAVLSKAGLYAQWRDAYDPAGWKLLESTTGKLA